MINLFLNIYYITEKREKRKRNVIKEMKEKRMENSFSNGSPSQMKHLIATVIIAGV